MASKLEPGDVAPPFNLPGTDGLDHRLEQHQSERVVVVAWFPKASTPG
jgi:peroxiredoxin Q/BCP